MNGIKAESTFLSMLSSDSFMKFPNNEASIQNLPISINIKKEVSHSDDEFYNSINPSTPDGENSVDLKLNQLSTSIIKNESIDIKDENYYTLDSLSLTPGPETSLISIKEESYGELENFKEVSSDKDLAKSQNTLCDICGKNFASLSSLQRHRRTVHLRKKNFTCDICNKSYTENYSLTHHKKTIHLKIKGPKCTHCDKSFTTKGSLNIHEKVVHLNIREWKCKLCDKFCGTKSHLKIHSRVHLHVGSEVCDICNKSFRFLQEHKYRVHSERRKNFKCNHCDKAFYSKRDLNRHIVIHSDVRDWKCKICEKSFKFKNNLISHEKIHLRNDSYTCANYSKSDPNL